MKLTYTRGLIWFSNCTGLSRMFELLSILFCFSCLVTEWQKAVQGDLSCPLLGMIRIYHECEGGIEKSVRTITDWYHEIGRVMTNGDHEGRIFLFHPHTNNRFFSCSPLNASFYIGNTWKRLPENPEYAEMRHGDVILTLQWREGSTCDQRTAVRFFSLGLVRVSHMGKNNGNPDSVWTWKFHVNIPRDN